MSIQLSEVIHFYLGCQLDTGTGRVILCAIQKEVIPCASFRLIVLNGNVIHEIPAAGVRPVLHRLSDMTEAEALHIARLAFFDQDMKYPDRDYKVYKPEPITVDKTPTTFAVKLSNDWWDKEIRIGLNTGTIWYPNPATGERVWNYQKIFVFLHKQQFDLYDLIDSGQAIDAKSSPVNKQP